MSTSVMMQCPIPDMTHGLCVEAKHGHGSKAMAQLIAMMRTWYGHDVQVHTDAACIPIPSEATALSLTTDGHVLYPHTIPGCSIGELAIIGSVNDTVVSGAIPYYVAVQFRLTEGFPLSELQHVCEDMGRTASNIGITIVTGDTKVVPKDKGDGIEITTTVAGFFTRHRTKLSPDMIVPGDSVIVTGELGRHYAAVAVARSEGKLRSPVTSDLKSLHTEVAALYQAGIRVHTMRDLTRGGLLSAACSIAEDSGTTIMLTESIIPHHPTARSACKKWGHELLACPNEGTMLVFVDAEDTARAVQVLRTAGSPNACCIGQVHERDTHSIAGEVVLKTTAGTERTLTMLPGESFNRIC
jgi:hydrogenase expression/formation protein HypE